MSENLIPMSERSKDEVRKIASRGGKKSGETRREKKRMKEYINLLLELDVKSDKMRATLSNLGIDEKDMTNEMAMMASVMNKAMKGDMQAVNFLRDTSGQMPANTINVSKVPTIVDDIK